MGACSFAYQFDEGSASLSSTKYKDNVLLSPISIKSSNSAYIYTIDYIKVSSANYTGCFLPSDHPLAVQVDPGSPSGSPLVQSPNGTMTLAWTDGATDVPVQYQVYFGNSPSNLSLVNMISTTTFLTPSLSYGQNYYWSINTVDEYGRSTWSVGTFSFSLVPSIDHFYCAPNPFRAGSQSTTCIFSSPGSGSGRMRIYTLPHADLVLDQTLNSLISGTNLWTYNGYDGNGKPLYNGVYMMILDLNGAQGNAEQKFKLLVVK
jgi:hypothetical protein